MNRVEFITSFNAPGYDLYGKNFLDSWEEHNPEYNLTVVYEGPVFRSRPPCDSILGLLMNTDDLAVMDERHNRVAGQAAADKRNDPDEVMNMFYNNYRFAAPKFGRKVMAISDSRLPKDGYRIWIDADVIVTKPFDVYLMSDIANPMDDISYLGRDNWGHSECGLVGYNLERAGLAFLDAFRMTYLSGNVYKMKEWHDSFVFDQIRISWEKHNDLVAYNIAHEADLEQLDMSKPLGPQNHKLDVWKKTNLQKYMTHLKGATKNE